MFSMKFLARLLAVMIAGMGLTWAARELSDAFLGPPAFRLTAAPDAAPAAAAPPPAATASPPAATVPPAPADATEQELHRARQALGTPATRGDAGPQEFKPTKPTPADLPLALPSDI
jgi:hypothetical protein